MWHSGQRRKRMTIQSANMENSVAAGVEVTHKLQRESWDSKSLRIQSRGPSGDENTIHKRRATQNTPQTPIARNDNGKLRRKRILCKLTSQATRNTPIHLRLVMLIKTSWATHHIEFFSVMNITERVSS